MFRRIRRNLPDDKDVSRIVARLKVFCKDEPFERLCTFDVGQLRGKTFRAAAELKDLCEDKMITMAQTTRRVSDSKKLSPIFGVQLG